MSCDYASYPWANTYTTANVSSADLTLKSVMKSIDEIKRIQVDYEEKLESIGIPKEFDHIITSNPKWLLDSIGAVESAPGMVGGIRILKNTALPHNTAILCDDKGHMLRIIRDLG